MILETVRVDGFTRPIRKIDDVYEFGLKVILKGLGANRDYCSNFWLNFQTASKFLIVSVKFILPENGVDEFMEPRRESDVR